MQPNIERKTLSLHANDPNKFGLTRGNSRAIRILIVSCVRGANMFPLTEERVGLFIENKKNIYPSTLECVLFP